VQGCAGTAVPGRRGDIAVGAGGSDRPRARGFQPGLVVPVGYADHALGSAQPVERVAGEHLGDDLLARRADAGGLLAA
jgi:hypothetical protein